MTGSVAPRQNALPTFTELARRFPEWARTNVPTVIVSAVVSGAVAYMFNIWLMAVRYEGSVTPAGAPATSKDNFVSGGLFWALLPMVVCSIVGYRRSVGRERFWRDLRGLPMMLVHLVRRDGTDGQVHLLWGAAVALAASLVVSPAVGAVIGVGVLAAAPSVIGNMVASLIAQVWQRIAHRVSPNKTAAVAPMMSAAVGLTGAAIALVGAFMLPGRGVRVLLALACAGGALFLNQKAKPAQTVALLLLAGGVWAIAETLFAAPALADDGGFAECGSTLDAWLRNCAGAGEVRRLGAMGGVIAALTAPLGTFIGGLVGGFPSDGGAWWDALGGGQGDGGGVRTDWPPREDGLPTGPRDPDTGEPLVVNDGRWGDVPEGFVWHNGGWVDPAAIGALPPLESSGSGGDQGGDDERPDRYRDNEPEAVKGNRPEPLDPDKGHTIDPEGRAVGPDGEPLKDPRTGADLRVDTEGNVRYGDDWVTPEEAAERIKVDNETLAARQRGQALIDEANAIRNRLNDPELDPAARAQLEADLRTKAIEINSEYGAKSILKGDRSGLADVLDGEIKKIYGEVDPRFVDMMNELGVTRGGRPFNGDDMWDVRNQSSKGLGMDRDFALNEKEIARLREALAGAEPGSEQARQLQEELLAAKRNAALEIDASKYADFLEQQRANAGSDAERAQIEAQIERVNAQRAAGATSIPISPSTWNDIAQDAYGRAYGEVTGADARRAMQGITQQFNAEAYRDLNAIRNDPRNAPMDRSNAEQTASVSPYKTLHNAEAVHRGDLTAGEAIMENARGYSKDMSTKLLPTLANDPNVDPDKLGRLQAIQETMARIGSGEILPGQADGALKVATGDPTMTMERAMRSVDANLEAAIRMHPDEPSGSRLGDAFGRATDLATFDHYVQQHLGEGKSIGEATALAGAQVAAGNAAMASGVVNPTLSMVGGSMLPGGMANLMPDQMTENTVATAWNAASAAASDIGSSLGSGQLDTTAIDKFAEAVAARGNADPFSGFGQAGALAGELYERTDGGSLAGDLQSIYETGAGREVLDENLGEFQSQVQEGTHGVVLQGYDEVFNAAANLAYDPGGTVGQLVEDVQNIWNHGVGDGYWEEAGMHTKEIIDKAPVIGMVAGGYEAVAEGIGEAGVGGFVTEMGEGAVALGGEAIEGVASAGGAAIDYIKSFF